MKKSCILGAVCASVFSIISMSSHAALIDNGGGLIYDTVLDITWAQPDVQRNWGDANTWAAGLTLGGVSGWRLPYISVAADAGPLTSPPVDCYIATELACRDNELGYMFYHNLDGTYGQSILTSGDPDLALFPSLLPAYYWSGTQLDAIDAWLHTFNLGLRGYGYIYNSHHTWAVHSGNVSAVPVPAAVWLFVSGLLGLIGISRRKKTA